ncbi:MAG: sugar phosphate isomerase/epimerase [Clostridia bacterium]|nr:sugar phosphate isomerase/epimerase [Clostridia bacterium]
MKIGVNCAAVKKTLQTFIGDKKGITITIKDALAFLKKAGYEYVDFGFGIYPNEMPDEEFYNEIASIKAYLDEIGMKISQTHGRTGYPKLTTQEIFERAVKEIKATAMLGCKYTVIHPLRTPKSNYNGEEEKRKAENLEFFNNLKPYLQEYDVVECIENLFGNDLERNICAPNTCSKPEEILYYLENLYSDRFGVCFDTGHMLLTGDITGDTVDGALQKLGKYVKVLHVHDNDKVKDKHYPPFMGYIDWKKFYSTVKEIDYKGVVSMEITPYKILPNPNEFALLEFFKFVKKLADFESIFEGDGQ